LMVATQCTGSIWGVGRAAGRGSIMSRRVPQLGKIASYVPSPWARCQNCLTRLSKCTIDDTAVCPLLFCFDGEMPH
jgi:hypothetical protein